MTAKLFIFGSFCEGQPLFHRIEKLIEYSLVARVRAKAVRLGVGFPALLKEESDWVQGNVIELANPEISLAILDELHGYNRSFPDKSLMLREYADVQIEDSVDSERVWIYYLNHLNLPKNISPIEGGDWLQSLVQTPPLVNTLTEKQTTYIHRLGKSSAREIVPIDLTLYRELMNLDLIVDKGRRLALSKLGKEVYKYLV